MKEAMTRRLFVTYFLMTTLLIILAALAFLAYNRYTLKTNAMSNLRQFGNSTAAQIDMQISSMDTVSIDIAANNNFLTLIRRFESGSDSRAEMIKEINCFLIQNYVNKSNIYRITVFTPQGDVFTTGVFELTKTQVKQEILRSAWLNDANLVNGRKFMQSPHGDCWDPSHPVRVISLLRAVRSSSGILAYIEVQQKVDELQTICESQWNGTPLEMAIFDSDNRIFYSNVEGSGALLEFIRKKPADYSYDTIEDRSGILSIAESNYTDWKILLLLDNSLLYAPLGYIEAAIVIIVVSMLLLMALFIRISTQKITNPINRLIGQINKINLNNLEKKLEGNYRSYEAHVLYSTFSELMERLRESIRKEKALQQLQTKAAFDMLQSKIGPHFLYNSLGCIANMCENGESAAAASACYDLSDILRYSANYRESIVSIQDELLSLNSYFSLMKFRYRQRLNFKVTAEDNLPPCRVPKLTLQPIVENAIKYSLIEAERVCVDVTVMLRGGLLCIRVGDNGGGIDGETLKCIRVSYEEYTADTPKLKSYEDLKFGGLGLMATLLRLNLCFGDRFRFEIGRSGSGGTLISLYIPPDGTNRQAEEKGDLKWNDTGS